eukprot:scaffold121510_cov36-Phaeocystis_antarctica.AAC.1
MVLSYEPILSGQRHPRLRSGTKVQEEVRLILLNPSPFLSGRRPAPAAPPSVLTKLNSPKIANKGAPRPTWVIRGQQRRLAARSRGCAGCSPPSPST